MTELDPHADDTPTYFAPPMTFQRVETDDELAAIPNPDALGLIPTCTPSTEGDDRDNA